MISKRLTWDLSEFHGGTDLRDGLFSNNQTRVRRLVNYRVDKGRHLVRRPPCGQVEGAFDSQTQGRVTIAGKHWTFAKKGDIITNTFASDVVSVLYFDNPDYCTTWELVDAGIFDSYAWALIRHEYPSSEYPQIVHLHVWDNLLYAPTFVQDPYFPGLWSPSMAELLDQVYDADFVPVIGQGATKLWTSTVRGNVHCSRTADPRVWNQRTKDSILQDGEFWVFVVPGGVGGKWSFVVPRPFAWMQGNDYWAYYDLEYVIGTDITGTFNEVGIDPVVDFTWRPQSVASRFSGGSAETRIDLQWGSAKSGLIRLRLCAGNTTVEVTKTPTITQTDYLETMLNTFAIGASKLRWQGGDEWDSSAFTTAELSENSSYILAVSTDNVAFPPLFPVSDTINGYYKMQQRWVKTITTKKLVKRLVKVLNTGWTPNAYAKFDGVKTLVNVADVSRIATGTYVRSLGGYGEESRTSGVLYKVSNINGTVLTLTNEAGANGDYTTDLNDSGDLRVRGKTSYGCVYEDGNTKITVDAFTKTLIEVGDVITCWVNTVVTGFTVLAVDSNWVTIGDASGNPKDARSTFYNTFVEFWLRKMATIEDYIYPFDPTSGSEWYAERVLEAVDNAGAEDALMLNTSSHNPNGGVVTGIAAIRGRMLVAYPNCMQLWQIDQNTNATAYLDAMQFGTTDADVAPLTAWYGSIVAPVVNGIRAINVVGTNNDNLQDLNIGEPIEPITAMAYSAATFWPWFGELIYAGINSDGALELRVLDYSRESKITAWSQWVVPAVEAIDRGTLGAIGEKLWFRANDGLYFFDAKATIFADFADESGNAYESSALFHYNDFGKPGSLKRFLQLDIVQSGICTVAFQLPPYGSWDEDGGPNINGPQVQGISYGRQRIPLAMTGCAIAPKIISRCESGHTLERLSLDFLLLQR